MSIVKFGAYAVEADGTHVVVNRLAEGASRQLLKLPAGFVVARKAAMAAKPVNGMSNLRKKVHKEVRSATKCTLAPAENGALLSGKMHDGSDWQMRLEEKPQGLWFCINVPGFDEVGLRFATTEAESFMGFGEQFSNLDMSGKAFVLNVSEQGIGRGAQPLTGLINLFFDGAGGNEFTTYAPMPVFVTNKGRAMCFEQDSIYWCDIKKKETGAAAISVWGNALSGWVFGGDGPLDLIEKHTAVTGRLPAMPGYVFGSILGVRGGKQVAEDVLQKCREHGAPVTALWIEDWQGRRGKNGGPPLWWRWYPDETLYPDFKNWVAGLNAEGIAVMGYANTFLSVDEANPLYVEGREKRYFVQNPDGTDLVNFFFTGKEYLYVIVDLTNPEAYAWLKERMKTGMVENGLSGWMADYGEYLPIGSKTYIEDSVKAHCQLPVLWAKLNAELIEECGKKGEILAFHRSGSRGSNQWATVYWAGDQNPTFDEHDGLASSITGILSGGVSGMSINHTDIGGFTTLMTPVYKLVRKKEVLLRWLEYAAFTPIFRTHDGSYANPLNYQFYYDEEGYNAFAKFGRVHEALEGYLREAQAEAVEKGWPMMRALCLHYPQDAVCRDIKHQYLLGEDILVSPVWHFNAADIKAYLPAGEWICPHSGAVYEGGQWLQLPAPLGKPAVLVRAQSPGAQSLVQTLKEAFDT